MMDDITRGILSGLLGLPIARWARRFKYPTIFFVGAIGTHVCLFVGVARVKGWTEAAHIVSSKLLTPIGVFLPIGIGLLAVLCVFFACLGSKDK